MKEAFHSQRIRRTGPTSSGEAEKGCRLGSIGLDLRSAHPGEGVYVCHVRLPYESVSVEGASVEETNGKDLPAVDASGPDVVPARRAVELSLCNRVAPGVGVLAADMGGEGE